MTIFQELAPKKDATSEFLSQPPANEKLMQEQNAQQTSKQLSFGIMTYDASKWSIVLNSPLKLSEVFGSSVVANARKYMNYEQDGKFDKIPSVGSYGVTPLSPVSKNNEYVCLNSHSYGQPYLMGVMTSGIGVEEHIHSFVFQLDKDAQNITSFNFQPLQENEKDAKLLFGELLDKLVMSSSSFTPNFLKTLGYTDNEISSAKKRAIEVKNAENELSAKKLNSWQKFSGAVSKEDAANSGFVHLSEIGTITPDSDKSLIYTSGLDLCFGIVGVLEDAQSGKVIKSVILHGAPGGSELASNFVDALTSGSQGQKVRVKLYMDLTADMANTYSVLKRSLKEKGVQMQIKYLYFPRAGAEYDRADMMAVTKEGKVLLNPQGLKGQPFESKTVVDYYEKNNKPLISEYK